MPIVDCQQSPTLSLIWAFYLKKDDTIPLAIPLSDPRELVKSTPGEAHKKSKYMCYYMIQKQYEKTSKHLAGCWEWERRRGHKTIK
jgi:hypothetical protein